jgi:hypothetical protein
MPAGRKWKIRHTDRPPRPEHWRPSRHRAGDRAKGAALKATEQPIDTSTAAGKCFLDMLGVFAEFETNLRRERQLEGIAKAKAEGVYKGRPASIDVVRVREMKAQGMGATAIAKALSIHRASVYRLLEGRQSPHDGPSRASHGGQSECGARTMIAETAQGERAFWNFCRFVELNFCRFVELQVCGDPDGATIPSEPFGRLHHVKCIRSGRMLPQVGGRVSPPVENVSFNRNANPLCADVRALQYAR